MTAARVHNAWSDRWAAIKAGHPGAEQQREATLTGPMTRARLSPDGEWTPWRHGVGSVLALLEEMAEGSGR